MVWQIAVPIAAQGVGSLISGRENAAYQRAVQKRAAEAAQREAARQDAYQDEAAGIFSQMLERSGAGNFEQDLTSSAESRVRGVPRAAQVETPISGNAHPVVQKAINERLAKAGTESRNYAQGRAGLDAYNDALFNWSQRLGRESQGLGTLLNFSRGSSRLLPAEQRAAAGSVNPGSGAGELLSGLGALGTVAAMWGR